MTEKKIKIWAAIVTVVFLIGFGGVYLTYYLSMKGANEKGKQMKCKENIGQSFIGKIVEINHYDYNQFMNKNFFAIKIKANNTATKFFEYQFNIDPNKNILEFARIGQSIIKAKNNDYFEIINNYGLKKTFKIPNCD